MSGKLNLLMEDYRMFLIYSSVDDCQTVSDLGTEPCLQKTSDR